MTELMYLQRPSLFETSAEITSTGSDDRGKYFILDHSLFYPQGGGQPADQGKIFTEKDVYGVVDVRKVDGEIRHYIDPDCPSDIHTGTVKMNIDKQRRDINTRYHSAGHLIAAIAEGLSPEIIAVKGHHFPGEAYVEFKGILPDAEVFANQLQTAINSKLSSQTAVIIEEFGAEKSAMLAESLPYEIPKSDSLRVCRIEGFTPAPCGGTHVKDLKEIGSIIIGRCRSKKGKTKVNYDVDQ